MELTKEREREEIDKERARIQLFFIKTLIIIFSNALYSMSVCFESMGIGELLGEEIQIGFSIRGGEFRSSSSKREREEIDKERARIQLFSIKTLIIIFSNALYLMSVCFESMGIGEFLGEEIQISFSIRGGEFRSSSSKREGKGWN